MIEKTCRCGKSKKNFKIDIGPFYVEECCLEAGYDELGNLKKKDIDLSEIASQGEIESEALNLKEDLSQEEDAKLLMEAEKKAERERKKIEKAAAKAAAKALKESQSK